MFVSVPAIMGFSGRMPSMGRRGFRNNQLWHVVGSRIPSAEPELVPDPPAGLIFPVATYFSSPVT